MCFEYEIPSTLKAKNKDKALEDGEIEPESKRLKNSQ